jgi:hypothetical protein
LFTQANHIVLTKNITVKIGTSDQQQLRFIGGSTQNADVQNIIFKLKPNCAANPHNHLLYYNRWDGCVGISATMTHQVIYDATRYLLLLAPLLVVENTVDSPFCNICVDSAQSLDLLQFLVPGSSDTIRDLDLFAARSGQCGILTHHGHPNPSFSPVSECHHALSEGQIFRYSVGAHAVAAATEPNGLDGLYRPWPSFLFRRNWFLSLGNQREHGAWTAANEYWIRPSRQAAFLSHSWVPAEVRTSGRRDNKGISPAALATHQDKFILSNWQVIKSKLLSDWTAPSALRDDFQPSRVNLSRRVERHVLSTRQQNAPEQKFDKKREKTAPRRRHTGDPRTAIPDRPSTEPRVIVESTENRETAKKWLTQIHKDSITQGQTPTEIHMPDIYAPDSQLEAFRKMLMLL